MLGRVANRVLHQVLHGHAQELSVAVHLGGILNAAGNLDVLLLGGQVGAVHRTRHKGGYGHRAAAGNHVGRLQTGEFNDVAHQRGEATRLLVQTTHKVLNRLRVIASLLNRLREQTHRAHRCLQLVRHVCHKVVTHALHARNFGAVVGEHQDVFVTQGGHANIQD